MNLRSRGMVARGIVTDWASWSRAILARRSATSPAASARTGLAGLPHRRSRRAPSCSGIRSSPPQHDVVVHDGAIEDHHIVADHDIAADRAGMHAGVAADAHAVADDAGEIS
jgi:hypothetical protein